MISFSGRHYPQFIILQSVRWYVSYALSYRNIEEMMKERGFEIDHATLNRWVLHYAPLLEQKSRKFKRITTPMGCFRKMHTAARTLAGIELMNMIKKKQLKFTKHIDQNLSPAQQFYRLATI
mgnify:CR=1 FL=1